MPNHRKSFFFVLTEVGGRAVAHKYTYMLHVGPTAEGPGVGLPQRGLVRTARRGAMAGRGGMGDSALLPIGQLTII